MTIARYISDLLYDYECVVIPGLGGFIVNDKPAKINYSTNYFNPPFREVMFNPYLRINDGLLLNYIAREEALTYNDAKIKVEAFAMECHLALDSGKQKQFEKVGTIYKDDNGKIIFKQDTSTNYNPNSYGLTSFFSPAVHQISEEERVKKAISIVKVEAEKATSKPKETIKRKDKRVVTKNNNKVISGDGITVSKRRSRYRNQLYFILFLLIAMLIGWGVTNKNIVTEYYAQYGSKVPVFYSNPGSYIANNVEIIPLKELNESASSLWLINLFKDNKKSGNSLSNDDLTFKHKSVGTTNSKDAVVNKENDSVLWGNVKKKNNNAIFVLKNPETTTASKENSNIFEKTVSSGSDETDHASATKEINTPDTKISTSHPTTPKPVSNPSGELTEPFPYFIIAGSFKSYNNAVKLVKQLKSNGFDALIAGTNQSGMTRVAYAGFRTWHEAVQRLSVIRQRNNPSAWIMKK